MIIGKDAVVTLTYKLFGDDGKLIERGKEPVAYLHGGYDGIFPKVEAGLEGKRRGDQVEVDLDPADAFGDYDGSLVRTEPRDRFPAKVRVGMQFEAPSDPQGHHRLVYTVTDVTADRVVIDGNHALAGKRLRFACTVTAVRQATAEELAHGHVHGPGGHHHG